MNRWDAGRIFFIFRMFRLAVALVTFTIAVPHKTSLAANIGPSGSDLCILKLTGEIALGDFEKFLVLSKQLFPGSDGESTHRDTICLNSPGGSLSEGVKFANHFFNEGVGTVIDRDASCLSACAVMFMLGTARGPEISFINRKLHVDGILGFHRPSLQLPSQEFVEVAALRLAFDQAFSAALDLIATANSIAPWSHQPMMKHDLIQNMLEHIGDDMFFIDTIDKAGRYEVTLFGKSWSGVLDEERAYYACLNSLGWQSQLTQDDISYQKPENNSDPTLHIVRRLNTIQSVNTFQINLSGYAEKGCIIYQENGGLFGCGVDEYTATKLGEGNCTESDFGQKSESLNEISVEYPWLRFRSTEKATKPAGTRTFRCRVSKSGKILDDEICARISKTTDDGNKIDYYIWPSGSKTVVMENSNRFELNGIPANVMQTDDGRCYRNSKTGNVFCYAAN